VTSVLRVGGQTYDLGPSEMVDGLFATISYRLEPDGRGSRYPIVMNRLYAGAAVSPSDASAAKRELQEIDARLAALPPDRVVWSLSNLRRRDDSLLPVNHAARNVRDYFIANGRPLMTLLDEAVRLGQDRSEPVELASSEAKDPYGGAKFALIVGFLWTAVGYVFLRHWVLAPYGSDSTQGPLLWPAGISMMAGGALAALKARYPGFHTWWNRHVWFSLLVVLSLVGSYLAMGILLKHR
jgi:hypothetical protein